MTPSKMQGTAVMESSHSTPPPGVQEDAPVLTVPQENHGSQLPPLHQGGSSQNSDDIWKMFWKKKTNRKLFHQASDSVRKVKKTISKIWFLDQCIKLTSYPQDMQNKHQGK